CSTPARRGPPSSRPLTVAIRAGSSLGSGCGGAAGATGTEPVPLLASDGGTSLRTPESPRPAGSRRGRRRNRLGAEVPMTQIAVAVMPIADVGAWRDFLDEISTGDRSEAHRAFLRRGGVARETAFRQETPMG